MSTNVDTQRDVKKMGYLKKQKTMKKKLFVLREESENGPARLEYYDSEKKFVCGRPKRSIHLHNCFSINAKADSKHKYAIVLYTREDCFTIICENESDRKEWLSAMISLRNYHMHGNSSSPLYEHIWPVTVKPKGLGSSKHLSAGQYRLCLMPKEISFIRQNKDTPDLVLQLASIRKCGHTECFFYLEPGRMAVTGSGVLWMQVEDAVIAQNMHEAILSFMTASSISADQPTFRPRRHTVTDKSKPSTLPVKQHSTPHTTSSVSVTRSKTMSAADQPSRWRVSRSPSKRTVGSSTVRSTTATDFGSFTHNLSMSSDAGQRARTDSTDSSFSRNANSFSADELDSPSEEFCLGSSTPTRTSDRLMQVDHHPLDFGLSPVPGRQSSSHPEADYFDTESLSRPTKMEVYMEMQVAQESTSVEKAAVKSRAAQHSKDLSAQDEDSYMNMALNVNKDEVNPISNDDTVDSEVQLDCARTGIKGKTSTLETPNQEHADGDEYILMNTGSGTVEESSYIDMSQNSSITASPALSSSSSLHDVPADSNYLPMAGGSRSNSITERDEYFEVGHNSLGYMAMSQTGSSPRLNHGLRPDRVCSYLADENTDQLLLRSSSLGSRSQLLQSKSLTESYLDMQKGQQVTNNGERASSTPMLSRTVSHKGQKNKGHGSQSADQKQLTKETLEEKDFLMEMNFNHRGKHSKEHEYEEVRPRSSSGGSHDFRSRTLSSGSQERCRAGSFGYREKLSKIASLARANVREHRKAENAHGHRQRITTICQESFHKRTSSFGAAISDMRPRSSSHGNARYMDMSGRSHGGCNHASSHDCLHHLSKRGSQESVTSAASDYLDMRPRVSTLPSQAFISMLKNKEHSRHSPRSPLLTDSDYLSMEHGKSSGESSAEYASMELHTQRSPDNHHHQGVSSRPKRGSTSSKVSFSSSESLNSNTSQSSDGHGLDRQRGLMSSPVPDGRAHVAKSKWPSRSAEREVRPVTSSLDDSYVLYSPVNSREPSPKPGGCGASLEKVSSPIRAEDEDTRVTGASANPVCRTDNKHDYVNVDYDRSKGLQMDQIADSRPKATNPLAYSSSSGRKMQSAVSSEWTAQASSAASHRETSLKCEGPSIPCPEAPSLVVASERRMGGHHTNHGQSGNSSCKSVHSRASTKVMEPSESITGKETVSKSHRPGGDHHDSGDKAPDGRKADQLGAESQTSAPQPDYMVITPYQSQPKPTTPVPFPSLQPVVSPVSDQVQLDKSQTPLPSPAGSVVKKSKAESVIVDMGQESTSSLSATMGNIHVSPVASSSAAEASTSAHSASDADLSQLVKPSASAPEVNYATLDLQATGDDHTADAKAHPNHAGSSSSAGSESPEELPLQYAQIDFKKSEQLRKSNAEKKTRAPFDL